MIRTVRTSDLELIERLDREILNLDDRIDFTEDLLYLAYDGDRLLGFATQKYLQGKNRGVTYFHRAGTFAQYRGQGAQTALIRRRLRDARSAGMVTAITYTMPYNVPSMRALIRCGFKPYRPYTEWCGSDVVYWERSLNERR